ncbi:hypothetical protein ACQKFO_22920 [Rossellomorea sp. NPDC071047]|uniref:hypothetical protein n=1 Tax=Rossellomorea sp. NPDC071047 TaxID=3390675 RepID=UPI003D047BDA
MSGNQSTSKKSMKINGFKFFQQHLDLLKIEIMNPEELGYSKPLSSSAVAMYIGIVSECSQSGLLDLGISIASICRKMNIAPQTGHDGLKQLIERGLILTRTYEGKVQYEVGGYDDYNRSRSESMGKTKGLSYFSVPYEIFASGVISKLVKANSNKGLLLLLRLSNSFHRDMNMWGKEGTTLKMEKFKEYLSERSSIRVRKVLNVLSPLFTFTPVDLTERNPRNIVDRIRKAVPQLVIKKYQVNISPSCLMERKEMETDVTQALKETEMQLKYMGFPLKAKERRGIHIIYRSYVREIAQYIDDLNLRKELVIGSVQKALMTLDEARMNENIQSVGGFLNKFYKKYVINFIKNNPGVASSVMTACDKTGAEYPKLLDLYITKHAAS